MRGAKQPTDSIRVLVQPFSKAPEIGLPASRCVAVAQVTQGADARRGIDKQQENRDEESLLSG